MKRNSQSTAMPGLVLSLASLILPPVSDLKADIFTQITTGPGADVGKSYGAAWGDYDGDGFIDLFISNASMDHGSTTQFLYHNNRDGTFSRITTGVVGTAFKYGRGAAWGDYDNDGYLDLVLVNIEQANNLFHNNGDAGFAGGVWSLVRSEHPVPWREQPYEHFSRSPRSFAWGPAPGHRL